MALGDDIIVEQQRLALAMLREVGTAPSPEEAVADWLKPRLRRNALFEHTVQQLRAAAEVELPMLAVALEGLRSLEGAEPGTSARLG